MSDATRLTYKDSGVDRAAADDAKNRIGELVRTTYTDGVVGEFGAFGGCFRVGDGDDSTILVASADGVGTKLKVAVMAERHHTVGQDLVNHCVNDVLVQGAAPLFFLDYLLPSLLSSPLRSASAFSPFSRNSWGTLHSKSCRRGARRDLRVPRQDQGTHGMLM